MVWVMGEWRRLFRCAQERCGGQTCMHTSLAHLDREERLPQHDK